ncbi:hypothetical protein [Nitratireductor sp. StC3]|uniref:hypothetical protein n=1 Tax=Nitratireductor sp. StC3 TaxID=2126741 RepID=UPI0011B265F6|nr:hypothetical protein [Nitratireductor sp. StC3]
MAKDEFIAWHNREHIPERVDIPGFMTGRRMREVSDDTYLTLYDLSGTEVLNSVAYQTRLNAPTEWTSRVVPHFLQTVRLLSERVATEGHGEGGYVLAARFTREQIEVATGTALRKLLSRYRTDDPEILAWHIYKTDSAASQKKTAESAARRNDADQSAATLLVEASSLDSLNALKMALADLLGKTSIVNLYTQEVTLVRDAEPGD